jgi:hypothetical protein
MTTANANNPDFWPVIVAVWVLSAITVVIAVWLLTRRFHRREATRGSGARQRQRSGHSGGARELHRRRISRRQRTRAQRPIPRRLNQKGAS